MEREAAKKIFKKLATCYPNWKIDRDIAESWIEELELAESDHVEANTREYIRESKFPPSIAEIIKPNQRIEALREKERTRKLIDELTDQEKQQPVDPPWKREGISREDWMRKILHDGKKL